MNKLINIEDIQRDNNKYYTFIDIEFEDRFIGKIFMSDKSKKRLVTKINNQKILDSFRHDVIGQSIIQVIY